MHSPLQLTTGSQLMSLKIRRFSRVLEIATFIEIEFKNYLEYDIQISNPTINIAYDYCALLGANSGRGDSKNLNFIWNDP